MANAEPFVNGRLKHSQIVVFSKSYSPEGKICETVLKNYKKHLSDDIFEWVNFEKRSDCSQVEDYLWLLSGKNNREVPLLFVKCRFMGGYSEILRMHTEGKLEKLLKDLKLEDSETEDEEEDEARGKDLEVSQVTVRVQELDESEVFVKVADWVSNNDYYADYDSQLQMAGDMPLEELRVLFQQAVNEKIKSTILVSEAEQDVPGEDPEWMVISGKNESLMKSLAISKETSAFMLKKSSQTLKTVTSSESVNSLTNDT